MRFALLLAPLTIVASVTAAPISSPAIPDPDSKPGPIPKLKTLPKNHLLWFGNQPYTNLAKKLLKGDEAAIGVWWEGCNHVIGGAGGRYVYIKKFMTKLPIFVVRCWRPVPGGEAIDVTMPLGSIIGAKGVKYNLEPYTLMDPPFGLL